MRIGLVYYFVSNINRSIAFYRDKLGMKCTALRPNGPHPWAEFDVGGTLLGLEEVGKRGKSCRPPWGGAIVSFQVKNIEKVRAGLESRGIHFVADILVFETVKVTQFKDPDGNLLELHERL